MSALSANRLTDQQGGIHSPVPQSFDLAVEDNVHIYSGALVQTDAAGYAVPAGSAYASAAPGQITWGAAQAEADNTVSGHTQGGISVRVFTGCFYWDVGTSADALTIANLGQTVYAIDDHTVGATYGTAAWQTVVHTGTGVSPGVTVSGTPLAINTNETITVEVNIILGGAVATATFQYRINGAGEWSATTTTASTVALKNGLTLNFAAGTYVLGDTYTQSYTGPRSKAGKFQGLSTELTTNGMAIVQTIPGVP